MMEDRDEIDMTIPCGFRQVNTRRTVSPTLIVARVVVEASRR
jgi:hypothetical protein